MSCSLTKQFKIACTSYIKISDVYNSKEKYTKVLSYSVVNKPIFSTPTRLTGVLAIFLTVQRTDK